MPDNVIGKIPEFTSNDTDSVDDMPVIGDRQESVGADQPAETTDEELVEEKETPTDTPADTEPVGPEKPNDSTVEFEKELSGLKTERDKLLEEIRSLRGTRRVVAEQKLVKVDQKIDDLKDMNPEDVNLIDRVLRAKGYITKEESHQMFYESVKQEEVDRFLEKFPEYKPINDSNDLNWNALQREFSEFAMPSDPHKIGYLLEKAHRNIVKAPSGPDEQVARQRIKTASVGSRGVSRLSSGIKSLNPRYRAELERGGWSEEEIADLEQGLE